MPFSTDRCTFFFGQNFTIIDYIPFISRIIIVLLFVFAIILITKGIIHNLSKSPNQNKENYFKRGLLIIIGIFCFISAIVILERLIPGFCFGFSKPVIRYGPL